MHAVLRVGTCSNNTKDTFVALLKAAATAFRVGISLLTERAIARERKRQAAAVIVERGRDPAEAAKVGMGCCGDQIRNKADREGAGCGTQMEKTGGLQGQHRRPEKWNCARSTEDAQSKTGGLVMEVGREGKEKKAEELSRSLHAILGNKAVRIMWCHEKMAEMKVMQLDESVQKEEFTARVAEAVEYSIMNVRVTSTHNGVGDEHRLGEVPPRGDDEDGGKRKNPRRTVIAEDPTHTSETPPVLQVSAGRALRS
ncbi:UNVERIFIED_CONTAM: hypothetical protein PYX00_006904 [Menopon gallinae]|uniref:Uncharacterized protein n=1 Tax=Menopon gallinae TaxID=328185 RepID=A0AAW2HXW3_9NEOP